MSFLKRRATPVKVQPPWESILGDAPLPQQVITLPVTNPVTNQVRFALFYAARPSHHTESLCQAALPALQAGMLQAIRQDLCTCA